MGKKKQHRKGVVRMDNGVLCSQSQGGGEITYFFHKGLGDYGKSLVGGATSRMFKECEWRNKLEKCLN